MSQAKELILFYRRSTDFCLPNTNVFCISLQYLFIISVLHDYRKYFQGIMKTIPFKDILFETSDCIQSVIVNTLYIYSNLWQIS